MKKNPKAFLELQDEYYKNIKEKTLSYNLCNYVWSILIKVSQGYSFNVSHTLGYSVVALQEANLAYHYPIVYWNCANLISDSGGMDSTVNYGKIATAISKMRDAGIVIDLPEINEVRFDFKPNAEKDEIIYGLKPISGIGSSIANAIIANQPYTSMQDFYNKMQIYKNSSDEAKFGDTAMIQLIKAGCFDSLENKPREEIMADFIRSISSPVKKLAMSNIEDLNAMGLLTIEQKQNELRWYRFRNYIFNKSNIDEQTGKSPNTFWYRLDRKYAEPYFLENFAPDMMENKDYKYNVQGYLVVKRGSFDKIFDKKMADFKEKVLTNDKYLDIINEARFKELWKEKADGNISKWEMDSLNYYYHDHELAKVNRKKHQISNFNLLPTEPEIADTYFYKGKEKARYALRRICGTVIDKDKNHSTVTLLTPDGVVVVRFYKGQFGFYDKEISKVNEDGSKTKIEKSWFKRGTKLMITGFRSEEQFIPKTYKDSYYKHSVQLIQSIDENGVLELISERADENSEEGKAIAV